MELLKLVKPDLAVAEATTPQPQRLRSLGAAILMAAIEDYRSLDGQTHKDAARFLYPRTKRYGAHYDWAVSLIDGINEAWLRDALDRHRVQWDRERVGKRISRRQKEEAMCV